MGLLNLLTFLVNVTRCEARIGTSYLLQQGCSTGQTKGGLTSSHLSARYTPRGHAPPPPYIVGEND